MEEIACLHVNYLQFTNCRNIPTFYIISIESDEGMFNHNSNQIFQNVGIFLQFTLCSLIIFFKMPKMQTGYNCFISILHFENGSCFNNTAKLSSILIHPTVIQIVGIFLHS